MVAIKTKILPTTYPNADRIRTDRIPTKSTIAEPNNSVIANPANVAAKTSPTIVADRATSI